MPNRIIRESLLDSDRYLGVDEGAQLLFTHMLLLADDFGCLSIAPAFIGRRCFVNRPTDERLNALIDQLSDADLVRVYEHRGARFAFIPRFRQRLKRETLKNPQPPDELLVDDSDAQEKFRKLNGHAFKGTAIGREAGGPAGARGPTQGIGLAADPISEPAKRSEGKGSEGKGSDMKGSEGKPAPASDNKSPVELASALAEKMRVKK